MARMQELESALIKADAAGNTEDARVLATEIRRLRAASAPVAQQEKPDGGFGRQMGLGARNVVEGLTDLGGIVTNPLMYGLSKVTGQPYQSFTDAAGQVLDDLGVPRAETPEERVYGDIGRSITGTGATLGAGAVASGARGIATSLAERIGQTLSAAPKSQIASAALGAGGAGVTREQGGTPAQQMVAGIVGGLGPATVSTVAGGATRRALRGGETGRKVVEDNIATFNRAGTQPTVGQATQNRALQGAESLLAKAPGSSGVMAKKANEQQAQIGARVEEIASDLAPRSSSTRAGRAIQQGIAGEGGFVDTFRAKSKQLYDKLDLYIPQHAGVTALNTQAMLAREAAPIAGARKVSEFLANSRLAGIRESLNADIEANNGVIPYSALKQIRSKVGEMMTDGSLIADIPTRGLKRLYAALTADMAKAVEATGDERALMAFRRANTHFRSGMSRVDLLEGVLDRNGGPEAVFGAAMTGTKEGATKLRAVMQSLPPESQKHVTAALVRRMGRAVNSKQDDLGEQFSVNTFLTNWNAMSKEARSAAFGRYGPKFAEDMQQIAKAAANLREGSAAFSNPSGTAAAGAQFGSVAGIVMALSSGYIKTAASIAGTMAISNSAARLFSSPRAASWLAASTKLPAHALAPQAVALAGIARQENDEDLALLAEHLKSISEPNQIKIELPQEPSQQE